MLILIKCNRFEDLKRLNCFNFDDKMIKISDFIYDYLFNCLNVLLIKLFRWMYWMFKSKLLINEFIVWCNKVLI